VVIAIDGPAGSGKSTVARRLAERLGFIYIDTGAMYRGVGLLALQRGVALSDAAALERLAASAGLRFAAGNRLMAGQEDLTGQIRTPEVADASSIVSTVAGVRREMVEIQRQLGRDNNVVMEGRDIGTVVFPDAEVKVFLKASPEERARRRFAEQPSGPSLEEVTAQIRERDARDTERDVSPLRQAPGAVAIDSTGLSIEEVVKKIEELTRPHRAG
jgi:cytidylate kinase